MFVTLVRRSSSFYVNAWPTVVSEAVDVLVRNLLLESFYVSRVVDMVFVRDVVHECSHVSPNRDSSRTRCSDEVELDEGICGCKS